MCSMLVAAAPFATRGGHPWNSNKMIIRKKVYYEIRCWIHLVGGYDAGLN